MILVRDEEGKSLVDDAFTGTVKLISKLTPQIPEGMSLTLVRFEDGGLTYWHDHPGEQVLLILEGKGRVGDSEEEFEVQAGDIIYTGPGEKHWHGALPGHSMTHLSITTVGPPKRYGPVE